MTNDENKRRQQDEHVRYIKNHLCDKDSKKPFVFISYKSDDWEIVLHEVVYTLVKEHGLNVYFDGSFDSHNSLWIKQFPQNMSSEYCKGVLAFLDNRYATSYATLMELMYSQTMLAGLGGKYSEEKGLPVIPVNLDKLTKLKSEVGEEDTGLGVLFHDGEERTNAKAEEKVFINAFEELKERKVLGKTKFMYHPGGQLKKSLCRAMLSDLLAYLQVNENWYKSGQSLDSLAASIRDACGDEVFSALDGPAEPPKPVVAPDQPEPSKPIVTPEPGKTESISLPDFLKKYNHNTFKKETFRQVRLVGQGEYAVYDTPFFDSAYPLVWSFVMKLLEERGEKYLYFVNEKNSGNKNPPFITAAEHQKRKEQKHPVTYRNLELPGLEGWSMCRHYGQYGWVNDVLRRRILELGLPLGPFSLEYIPNSNEQIEKPETVYGEGEPESSSKGEGSEPVGEEEGAQPTVSIGGPVDLDGKTGTQRKQGPKEGGYSFTLRGERYHGLILKNMMLTVFKTTLIRHPDKLDMLLQSMPCLREGLEISLDAQPSTFRAGDTIDINGRSISIGTSLNRAQAQKYMEKLIQLCGEPKGNFVIDGDDG